ncbi:MAG: putative integral rane protein [Streptomyces oryziradicis]|nr:putative integral rane protein [Actinacidiphila oryziradicis]
MRGSRESQDGRSRGVSRSRRALSLAAMLTGAQTALVPLASRAAAAPTPTPSASTGNPACRFITGAAKALCEQSNSGSTGPSVTSTLDPLSSLARGCADAAAWVITQLSKAVTKTAAVDFTNTTFLRQYAVVFAASTVLTLVLWLLAVAKRAVRGIPLTEALTEAIGFLWLTVIASAFTPLILYTVVQAVDAVTTVIASGTSSNTDVFFGSFSNALSKDTNIGGGPIMLIVVSLVSVLAAGVLWLELVIRAALLYVGAMLGTVVYSGLVDKNMWRHVKGWAGVMIAVIMVKPVIVIVLGLAGALSSSNGPDAFGAVVSGLAIILLAIFASFMIYRFVPGFGDDVQELRNNRKASGQSQAAAVISSPAALVKQGIKTHSARGGPQEQGSGGGGAQPGNPMAGGVAAHSSRTGNPGPSAAAPPPRTQDRSNNGKPGGDRR